MRQKMERFVLLPFSVGCISESSIAIGNGNGIQQPRGSKLDSNSFPIRSRKEVEEEEEGESLSDESMKNSYRFLALPKPNISTGFHRLCKGFKNFSQLFVYKEEIEEEMEIGSPTDVKHVTHIGWDDGEDQIASAKNIANHNNYPLMGCDNLLTPQFLSSSSVQYWRPFHHNDHLPIISSSQPPPPSIVNINASS